MEEGEFIWETTVNEISSYKEPEGKVEQRPPWLRFRQGGNELSLTGSCATSSCFLPHFSCLLLISRVRHEDGEEWMRAIKAVVEDERDGSISVLNNFLILECFTDSHFRTTKSLGWGGVGGGGKALFSFLLIWALSKFPFPSLIITGSLDTLVTWYLDPAVAASATRREAWTLGHFPAPAPCPGPCTWWGKAEQVADSLVKLILLWYLSSRSLSPSSSSSLSMFIWDVNWAISVSAGLPQRRVESSILLLILMGCWSNCYANKLALLFRQNFFMWKFPRSLLNLWFRALWFLLGFFREFYYWLEQIRNSVMHVFLHFNSMLNLAYTTVYTNTELPGKCWCSSV